MRKPKFNEKKYNAALQELAKQIAAMVHEDHDLETEREAFELALADYTGDTIFDLKGAVDDYAYKAG